MKEIKIVSRWDSSKIIVCGKYESIKDCLQENRSADLQGADLQGADLQGAYLRGADLQGADLQGADLQGADLRGADLQGADLQGADLQGADLRGAYLRGAYLRGADLQGAYLQGAKYTEPSFLPDLYSLKLLPPKTKLIFWKYLKDGKSPYQGTEYKVGKTYTEKEYDTDEQVSCGLGLNVATLMWCLKDDPETDEFIQVEFTPSDIVAIPYGTDGKFRVKKFKVLKKHNRKQVVKLLTKTMETKQ